MTAFPIGNSSASVSMLVWCMHVFALYGAACQDTLCVASPCLRDVGYASAPTHQQQHSTHNAPGRVASTTTQPP